MSDCIVVQPSVHALAEPGDVSVRGFLAIELQERIIEAVTAAIVPDQTTIVKCFVMHPVVDDSLFTPGIAVADHGYLAKRISVYYRAADFQETRRSLGFHPATPHSLFHVDEIPSIGGDHLIAHLDRLCGLMTATS